MLLVIKTCRSCHSRTRRVKSDLFQSLTVVFLEKSDPNIGLRRSGRCRCGVLMAVPPSACRAGPREQQGSRARHRTCSMCLPAMLACSWVWFSAVARTPVCGRSGSSGLASCNRSPVCALQGRLQGRAWEEGMPGNQFQTPSLLLPAKWRCAYQERFLWGMCVMHQPSMRTA